MVQQKPLPAFLFLPAGFGPSRQVERKRNPAAVWRGSNLAPAERGFTSDFKNIKVFNGRTKNFKGLCNLSVNADSCKKGDNL